MRIFLCLWRISRAIYYIDVVVIWCPELLWRIKQSVSSWHLKTTPTIVASLWLKQSLKQQKKKKSQKKLAKLLACCLQLLWSEMFTTAAQRSRVPEHVDRHPKTHTQSGHTLAFPCIFLHNHPGVFQQRSEFWAQSFFSFWPFNVKERGECKKCRLNKAALLVMVQLICQMGTGDERNGRHEVL